jgi:hypothetical protein
MIRIAKEALASCSACGATGLARSGPSRRYPKRHDTERVAQLDRAFEVDGALRMMTSAPEQSLAIDRKQPHHGARSGKATVALWWSLATDFLSAASTFSTGNR